ncbi:MAG: hypothetical protein ACKV0T_25260 [Planctomycetales bacterium]
MSKRSRWMFPLLIGLVAVYASVVSSTAAERQLAEKPLPREGKIKFKDAAGQTACSLKLKDNGGKLVDGNEKELARYSRSENRIKIKDAQDGVLGFVVIDGQTLHLEAPDQTKRFSLRKSEKGWTVEDGGGTRVALIQPKGTGCEIEDPQGKRQRDVTVKGGKTTLHNAAGKVIYQTNEAISPAALSCLGLEAIDDLRLRGALMFAVEYGIKP